MGANATKPIVCLTFYHWPRDNDDTKLAHHVQSKNNGQGQGLNCTSIRADVLSEDEDRENEKESSKGKLTLSLGDDTAFIKVRLMCFICQRQYSLQSYMR